MSSAFDDKGTAMKKLLGLVLAMPLEAYALVGWKRWERGNGYPSRRQHLSREVELLWIRSGSGMDHALAAARRLVSEGVSSLMALGLSGGLQPSLRQGDIIIADSVFEENGRVTTACWETDSSAAAQARAVLTAKGISCRRGAVVTNPVPVLSAAQKKGLFVKTRALAVDMESAAVARAAAEAGLPLFILRAICDGPATSLPGEFSGLFNGAGTISWPRLFSRIQERPSLLPGLCSLARDCMVALRSLRKAWILQMESGLLPPAAGIWQRSSRGIRIKEKG